MEHSTSKILSPIIKGLGENRGQVRTLYQAKSYKALLLIKSSKISFKLHLAFFFLRIWKAVTALSENLMEVVKLRVV